MKHRLTKMRAGLRTTNLLLILLTLVVGCDSGAGFATKSEAIKAYCNPGVQDDWFSVKLKNTLLSVFSFSDALVLTRPGGCERALKVYDESGEGK